MPGFPWLMEKHPRRGVNSKKNYQYLETFGVPYTDEDIAGAKEAVQGKN